MVQTVADVDDSCICKPFNTSYVVSIASILANLGYLETFVFFGQEGGDVIVDSFDFYLVQALDILGDIFFVVFKQLFLHTKGSAEILVLDVCVHHFWHTAYSGIVAEKTEKHFHLQVTKGLYLNHMLKEFLYKILGIAFCP